MALTPDPADKALDAAADGAFGGKPVDNRRAGYGGVVFDGVHYSKMEWLLRNARRGDCLAWGESAKLVDYYEEKIAKLEQENAVLLLALGADIPSDRFDHAD